MLNQNIQNVRRCKNCVMPEIKGRIELDEEGVCDICRRRARENPREGSDKTAPAKESGDGLETLKKKILFYKNKDANYDCAVSLSGGKDSTMTLYVAKKMLNLKPLAIFVDNGFALPEMYENVHNASDKLGVDLIIYKTASLLKIFKECLLSSQKVYYCRLCHTLLEYYVKKNAYGNRLNIILGGYTKGQQYIKNDELFWIYDQSDHNIKKIFSEITIDEDLKELLMGPTAYMNKKFGNMLQISPFKYMAWDEDEIVRILQEELDFKKSKDSWPENSSNCMFNYVAQYKALKDFGYSQHETELSDLVRNDEMKRERALKIITTPLLDKHIKTALNKLNLDFSHL